MDAEEKNFVGAFTTLLADVEAVEAENEQLEALLKAGRSRVGEFHAQLMIDNLKLVQERTSRSERLAEVTKQEELLKDRVRFLFDDCKRLSRDNDAMIEEAKRRDEELRATERLLRQQEAVCQSTFRALDRAKLARRSAAESVHEAEVNKFKMREKVIAQHVSRWEMQDRLDLSSKESTQLRLQQLTPEPRRSVAFLPNIFGATPGGSKLTSAQQQQQAEHESHQVCMRPDCVEIRQQLAAISHLLGHR